jgi:hypothetical protein
MWTQQSDDPKNIFVKSNLINFIENTLSNGSILSNAKVIPESEVDNLYEFQDLKI